MDRLGQKKILILYTEPPTYFLACVRKFTELFQAEVHIVEWSVNRREAPYEALPISNVFYYERVDYSVRKLLTLSKSISPDLVFCGGWKDRGYLSICRYFYDKIPVILAMDHKWFGTVKQRLTALLARFYSRKIFSHIWIPGDIQYEYARHLGFREGQILKGLYSADFDLFRQSYQPWNGKNHRVFPKRFFFSGRYLAAKGLRELWYAFLELEADVPNSWELWCIGTGPLNEEFPAHSRIKSFGFVGPAKAANLMKDAGVFVLPSHGDTWSVSVHECAAAGMPLICSDQVGAATIFLKEG